MTTGLARELGAQGIRINTITPGWIMTERQIAEHFTDPADREKSQATLFGRQALRYEIQPGDIATHVLFYLSGGQSRLDGP